MDRDFSETLADCVLVRRGPDVEEYADGARPFHIKIDSVVVNNELWKLLDRWARCRRRRTITRKNTRRQRRMNVIAPSTPARIPTVAAEVWVLLDALVIARLDSGDIADADTSGSDGVTMK